MPVTAAIRDAETHLNNGDLSAALASLQNAIRADPANSKLRIFLFQLLSVLGDWKRAITQLKLCAEMDAAALPMAQTYREAIICEVFREKVFAGEKQPLVFGEPQDWVAQLIEALSLQAKGHTTEAAAMRDQAFEAAPASAGTVNGNTFQWVADADMRLGPILEAVINGKYYWLPINVIAEIVVDPPEDLRDAVWTACNLTLKNGGEFVALLPTRYAGTAIHGNDAQKLARATNWDDVGADTFVGIGQRLLATDHGDMPLMDLRHMVMADASDASGKEAADG